MGALYFLLYWQGSGGSTPTPTPTATFSFLDFTLTGRNAWGLRLG